MPGARQAIRANARKSSPFTAEGSCELPPPATAPAADEAPFVAKTEAPVAGKEKQTWRRKGMLRNLPICNKLAIGFAGVFGLMAIVVAVGVENLSALSAQAGKTEDINRLSEMFHDAQIAVEEFHVDDDKKRLLAVKELLRAFRHEAERVRGRIKNPADKETTKDMIESFAAFESVFDEYWKQTLQYQASAGDLIEVGRRMQETAIEIGDQHNIRRNQKQTTGAQQDNVGALTARAEMLRSILNNLNAIIALMDADREKGGKLSSTLLGRLKIVQSMAEGTKDWPGRDDVLRQLADQVARLDRAQAASDPMDAEKTRGNLETIANLFREKRDKLLTEADVLTAKSGVPIGLPDGQPASIEDAIKLIKLTAEAKRQTKNFWLYEDRNRVIGQHQAVDALIAQVDSMRATADSPKAVQRLQAIGDTARAYRNAFVRLVDLANQRESTLLVMLSVAQRTKADILRARRDQGRDLLVQIAASRNIILAVSAAALACSILWAWSISRCITRPVGKVILAMEDLSMGNLNAKLPSEDRLDEFGAMASLLRTFRDTEIQRRRLINASLKSQREFMESADTANKAKSEFLRSMSHELRTPMNAILGFSQLLASDTDSPLDDEQRENVDQITKAGQHLLDLINDVLELNKIEAGAIRLSIENVIARNLIEECLALIGPNADKRGITIGNHSGGAGTFVVRADYTRLKQCLLNILSNAIKYNWDNGNVIVNCAPTANNRFRIGVTNTGPGIPEGRHKELFQPFNRLGAETTEIEGSGIGLNVTKRLIELMDGAIGFQSKHDQGTTFWLDVPLSDSAPDAVSAAKHDRAAKLENVLAAGKAAATILYVEDNPANLRLVEEILKKIPNVFMLAASSPGLGLELAESRAPDLILLDINLPGMSGFEVLKALKRSKITCDIPVLALSANAMPRDIEKGLRAGFDGYLTKPINISALTKAIGENIARAQ